MICELCGVVIKNNNGLGKHLKIHKMNFENYILKSKYNGIHPVCKCGCGILTKFRKGGLCNFSTFINHHNDNFIIEKRKKTFEKTCFNKYGVKHPAQRKDYIFPISKNKLSIEQIKINLFNVHGERVVLDESTYIDTHTKCRFIDKDFGEWWSTPNNVIGQKQRHPAGKGIRIKNTCIKKYGVSNPSQILEVKKIKEKKGLLTEEKILERCKQKGYILLSDIKNYSGDRNLMEFLCIKHNEKFFNNIFCISQENTHQCPKCRLHGTSKTEIEIADFVKNLNLDIICNKRIIIPPKELDIYIPKKNIAIEYHGLAIHSERNPFASIFDKNCHFNKFQMCKEKGIRLIQFFEDEWRDKQNICKSMIKNVLGVIEKKINARDLIIVEDIDKNKIIDFINKNHLQGYQNKKPLKSFSLIDSNTKEIFICITLRKPFIKSENLIEIERECSKVDFLIRGGYSRLLKRIKYWAKQQEYEKIITYSDCRYSWGNIYKINNFSLIHHTGISYDYTNGQNRFGRFKFRAQDGKSEKQIAEENKVYKIYGAGNYLWELKL